MQTTSASQPIYKKSVLNGRGVVRFTRGDVSGLTGQRLELFQNSSSSNKGFASSNSNPFTNSSNEWTLFVVARTTQATGDVGSMGIFSAGQTNYSDDRGMHIYKSCSTCVSSGGVNGGQAPACFPGKFTRFRCFLPIPFYRQSVIFCLQHFKSELWRYDAAIWISN
mmetsp:Transcript_88906/g.236916  ORF Transcript_88906/g.236916 Transcript_88906/m.236916 type:complete len:166 (+) Transcript_88906:277-774(+)